MNKKLLSLTILFVSSFSLVCSDEVGLVKKKLGNSSEEESIAAAKTLLLFKVGSRDKATAAEKRPCEEDDACVSNGTDAGGRPKRSRRALTSQEIKSITDDFKIEKVYWLPNSGNLSLDFSHRSTCGRTEGKLHCLYCDNPDKNCSKESVFKSLSCKISKQILPCIEKRGANVTVGETKCDEEAYTEFVKNILKKNDELNQAIEELISSSKKDPEVSNFHKYKPDTRNPNNLMLWFPHEGCKKGHFVTTECDDLIPSEPEELLAQRIRGTIYRCPNKTAMKVSTAEEVKEIAKGLLEKYKSEIEKKSRDKK